MLSQVEDRLVITKRFDSPPEDVFEAWVVCERFQQWIGPKGVDCRVTLFEPQPGGRYRLLMCPPDGSLIAVAGYFEVVERPRLLRFTWGLEGDPAKQSLVTIHFEDVDGATELTLVQEGLGTAESRCSHEAGWTSAFVKLEEYLEGNRANEA